MTPRPILFVDHATALGGAETSLLLLMTFLDRAHWQPHLIAPPGQLAEEGKPEQASPCIGKNCPRSAAPPAACSICGNEQKTFHRPPAISTQPSSTATQYARQHTLPWLPGSHPYPWSGTCATSGSPSPSQPPNGPTASENTSSPAPPARVVTNSRAGRFTPAPPQPGNSPPQRHRPFTL